MLQRLCDTFGEEKENMIKQILHQEYNSSTNRYKDLTYDYFDNLLKKRLLKGGRAGNESARMS